MVIRHEDVVGKAPEELLVVLGLEEPPFDPFEMAKKLGINVDLSFSLKHVGELGYISKNGHDFTIWVNPMSPPDVQRFTVAHEIAHFVEHIKVNDTKVLFNFPAVVESSIDSRELAANKYAAELLMPESAVIEQTDRLLNIPDLTIGELVGGIAWKFQVPERIAFERLKGLGYNFD